MLNPPAQNNHIKTSSDILQEFNSRQQGSHEFRPSIVQINHQTKSLAAQSNHNLSNYDAINQSNQYVTPQPLSQIQQQNNIIKSKQNDIYYSNNGGQQMNFQDYLQENQSKIQKLNQLQLQQQQKFEQNTQASNNIFNSQIQKSQNFRGDNLNSISSRIEEHQRLSQKKPSNKLYDSFIGKEKDLESSFSNEKENLKKTKLQNNEQSNNFKEMTSREIGLSLLEQEQKRYFNISSPEYLSNAILLKRNRGMYKGQVKQIKNETVLEGIGQLEMINGDIYMGYFWRNYMHGDGYLLKQNGDFYNGKFQNDKIQGFGRYYYINGDQYEGNFYYGVRQSEKSKFYSAVEDAWYEIPFDQDKKHGKGIRKDNQGNVMNVEFFWDILQIGENVNISHLNMNEYFVSKIKEEEIRPIVIEEEKVKKTKQIKPVDVHKQAMEELNRIIFNDRLPVYSYETTIQSPIQGEGIYKFEDGSYYAGFWLDGKFDGFGHYYDSQVGLYKGYFAAGQKNGFADMLYLNGDSYHGSWVKDLKHDDNAQYFKFNKQKKYQAQFNSGNLIRIISEINEY